MEEAKVNRNGITIVYINHNPFVKSTRCATQHPLGCADNHLSRFKGWPARPRSSPPSIDLDRAATGLYRARRDIVVEKIVAH
jgi:hypothetical protein